MAQPSVAGWLEKKSGGKEGNSKSRLLEKWDKRWFALVGSQLGYYKSEEDFAMGREPLGSIDCAGAEIFLKEVKGIAFRFTVRTRNRELKLRAASPTDYHMWSNALTQIAQSVGHLHQVGETFIEGDREAISDVEGPLLTAAIAAAAPSTPQPSVTGWLEKKSGGKEGSSKSRLLEKWTKRWFALVGSELGYYKSEEDFSKCREALGSMECAGAEIFLKEVKGGTFRFTIRTPTRELKLRASTAADYQSWTRALAPLANRSTWRSEHDDDESERMELQDDDEVIDSLSGSSSSGPGCSNPFDQEVDVNKSADVDNLDEGTLSQLRDQGRVSTTEPWSGPEASNTSRMPVSSKADAPEELDKALSLDSLFSESDEEGDSIIAPRESAGPDNSVGAKRASANAESRARGNSWLSTLFAPRKSSSPTAPCESEAPKITEGNSAGACGGRPDGSLHAELPMLNPFGAPNPFGEPPAPAPTTPLPGGDSASGSSAFVAAQPITSQPATIRAGSTMASNGSAPFKIIIVGDSGVGKTSLMMRFVEGRYTGSEKPTVAVDVSTAALDLGSSTVGLALWDTAGQERFAPLSTPYFRQADGVIMVFDVGEHASFERIQTYWLEELERKASPDVSTMLIGAKADVAENARQVFPDEAKQFADSQGWLYFETSAKTGVHVRDAFYLLGM